MKILIPYLLVFVLTIGAGCGPTNSDKQRLREAELLTDSSPEQALNKLQEIKHFNRLPDSCQAKFGFLMTKALLNTNRPINTHSGIDQAIHYYRKHKDTCQLGLAMYYRALSSYTHRDFQDVMPPLMYAKELAAKTKNLRQLVLINQLIGFYDLFCDQKAEALQIQAEALSQARVLNDSSLLLDILINNIEVCKLNEQYDRALGLSNEALLMAEKKKNTALQQTILGFQSTIHESRMEYDLALSDLNKIRKMGIERKDIPTWNLAKVILFDKQRQMDSVYYYARIALHGNDSFAADVAYSILSNWEMKQGHFMTALGYAQTKRDLINHFSSNLHSEGLQQKYDKEKLKNENNQLKIKQKEKDILLLTLLFVVLLIFVLIYIYQLMQTKKREEKERLISEELLKNKALQLEQDNLLLKQAGEISLLKEKEALLRESLIRRIHFFKKIPSLSNNENTDYPPNEHSQKILFTETDWNDLKKGIDEVYPDYFNRLQKQYPQLDENDIRFCSLVKINVSLQDLSDIYCLSKAGITKKKYRLKKDKLGITDRDLSLDDSLQKI